MNGHYTQSPYAKEKKEMNHNNRQKNNVNKHQHHFWLDKFQKLGEKTVLKSRINEKKLKQRKLNT